MLTLDSCRNYLRHMLGIPAAGGVNQVAATSSSPRDYAYIGNDNYPNAGGITHYPSAPWPIRLEGNDVQTWIEPMASDYSEYQTFFAGNQLPGFFQSPNLATGAIMGLHIESPNRDAASFGPNLGQVGTLNLVDRWRGIWSAASGS